MQVDIREHGADWATLRDPFIHVSDDAVLHHAGFQPFVQEANQPTVVDSVSYNFLSHAQLTESK